MTNKLQLLGSTTSPFVRRIRLYFQGLNYDFVNLDIFSEEGREILSKNNPTQKVPALLDGDLCIYDSRVIFRYLSEKLELPNISWPQENLLTLIDGANDSLVTILLSKRSNLDVNEDKLFFNLQHERVNKILTVLNQEAKKGVFTQWHYPSVCLFCLLDWLTFRELADLTPFAALQEFYQQGMLQSGVKETDPR